MGLMPTVGLSDPWLIMVAIPMPWLSWIITQGLLPLIYIYLADWDWLCELLDYTEEPDTTRDQLVEFYNKIRTEIPELDGYPEYN